MHMTFLAPKLLFFFPPPTSNTAATDRVMVSFTETAVANNLLELVISFCMAHAMQTSEKEV